jgi:hypothetical protein
LPLSEMITAFFPILSYRSHFGFKFL